MMLQAQYLEAYNLTPLLYSGKKKKKEKINKANKQKNTKNKTKKKQ